MRESIRLTIVLLLAGALIGLAFGPAYSQHPGLKSTRASTVVINPAAASESEQAISILSLPWGQDETTAVQTPQAASPLPDKFLFAIGAQAPVGQFNSPGGIATAPGGTVHMADTQNPPIRHFATLGAYPDSLTTTDGAEGLFSWLAEVSLASDWSISILVRSKGQIYFRWGYGAPAAGLPADELQRTPAALCMARRWHLLAPIC